MRRRAFIRAMLALGAVPKLLLSQQTANPAPPPPAPVPWLLGLTPQTPIPHVEAADQVATAQLRFFSPEQMETLTRLCDVLMPPVGNKPGAVQAQTPMFLDFFVGSSPEKCKRVYADGLDWLNSESKKKYNTEFAKVTDHQADDLLRPWLRTWFRDHPPTEQHAEFVNIAHDDIRRATVNSKTWAVVPEVGAEPRTEEELYWSSIQPVVTKDRAVCAKVPPHLQASSSHSTPSQHSHLETGCY